MTIEEIKGENSIQLSVEGIIDAETAPELRQKILDMFSVYDSVVLDLGHVWEISSAGLGALLVGQKTADDINGSMKIINVLPAVMQVLDMSGVSKSLTIDNDHSA